MASSRNANCKTYDWRILATLAGDYIRCRAAPSADANRAFGRLGDSDTQPCVDAEVQRLQRRYFYNIFSKGAVMKRRYALTLATGLVMSIAPSMVGATTWLSLAGIE